MSLRIEGMAGFERRRRMNFLTALPEFPTLFAVLCREERKEQKSRRNEAKRSSRTGVLRD